MISQPLVYLVQVPFNHELGWGLFYYYIPWIWWTLATIPMAFVGYFIKKDKWWGLLILEAPDGTQYLYDLTIERTSYELERIQE